MATVNAAGEVCGLMKSILRTLEKCGLLETYSITYHFKVNLVINLNLESDITRHLNIVREELAVMSEKCFSSIAQSYDHTPLTKNAVEINKFKSSSFTHGNDAITEEESHECSQTPLHDSIASTSTEIAHAGLNNSLNWNTKEFQYEKVRDSLRESSTLSISPCPDDAPRASSQLSKTSSDRSTSLSPEPLPQKLSFFCKICEKSFQYKKNLKSHVQDKHRIGGLKKTVINLMCGICDKVFVNKQRLDVHCATHMSQKPFSCKTCGKTFAQKSTRDNHLSQHTGLFKFTCKECPKAFVNQAKLNFHMYKHQEPRHICEFCGKTFIRKDVFISHVKRHDPSKNNICAVCGKAFRSKTFLKLHGMGDHTAINSPKHLCAECGSTYKRKSNLERHTETQISRTDISTRSSKFPNKICPTTHSTREHGDKQTEKSEQQFNCSQCTRTYKFKHNLKVHEKSHLETTPENAKPHNCSYCNKRFTKKCRLDLHVKTHQQAPDLSCEICGQRFYRKEVLKNHIFLHTNQRPYKCDLCEKAFASKTNLSVHLLTHNTDLEENSEGGLVCGFCQRKFKQKASFNAHLKAHRGEFQYECHICYKKFVRKGHFEGHLRSHSKERPHVCPICEKGFKEKKHRREHLKRMHPNEFNLDTLFASITTEDAQIAEMITMDDQQADTTLRQQNI